MINFMPQNNFEMYFGAAEYYMCVLKVFSPETI